MNTTPSTIGQMSLAARKRMLSRRGEPLFVASWVRTLMIHFEVDARTLQKVVPYELDLLNGRAFVSLVAFTMRGMRPRWGGRAAALLFRPIATHDFLNVRTYVRHGGERGIHFIAEWLTNRLAVMLGPSTFGLPYRHGRIAYGHFYENGNLSGQVMNMRSGAKLVYSAKLNELPIFKPCEGGSLSEWLMERYTAFNSAGGRKRFFRVWHPTWPQCRMDVSMKDKSLLTRNWPWFEEAELMGANFSPGFDEVWMGRPHRISK